MFDDQLNFYSHIKQIVSKLHIIDYVINRVSRLLSTSSLIMLYNTLCLPYRLYCCETWGRANGYLLNKIHYYRENLSEWSIYLDI